MKKILFIALAFVLSSCVKTKTYKDKLQVHHENLEPQEIVVKKYNDALFSIDTANFSEGLKSIKDDYLVFLGGDLDNMEAVEYLKDFATDTFCIRLNDMVQKKFTYNNESERFECNVGDSIVGYEFPAFAEIGTLKEKLWKSGMRG